MDKVVLNTAKEASHSILLAETHLPVHQNLYIISAYSVALIILGFLAIKTLIDRNK